MRSPHTIAALIIASTAFLTGCANTTAAPPSSAGSSTSTNVASGYGTIDSIQMVHAPAGTTGGGAVIGGLVGALVGNQIGSGTGRTVATVAGAAGGAMVGNKVEANRNAGAADKYQINIRMDNGEYRSVTQDSANDLSAGTRVRIVDGRAYRL
jgi:outer membrane lipoprotein SlyB